jgi:hypothetical protein
MTDQERPAAQRTDDGDGPDPRPAPGPAGRNGNDGSARPPVRPEDGRSDSTLSFRPIIGERHVGRFEVLLRRRPVRGHVGLVLVTQRGEHHSFRPDRQPTTGELLWLGSGTLYEVDMGRHWARVELEVPSRTEAFSFDAVVDVEWWVADPVPVVKHSVHDVRKALEPNLRQRLSAITRKWEVEDSAHAEDEATDSLAGMPVGAEYGLDTRAFVRLRMDTPSVQHASNVRDVHREIELERATQELRLVREESTSALITRRVQRYRVILQSGNLDQFALQLAQNPDETPAVIQMLREERHNNRRAVTDFVTRLLDSGAVDRHEIDDQVREALRWLKDATDTVLGDPNKPARIPASRPDDALPPGQIPAGELPEPPLPPSDTS